MKILDIDKIKEVLDFSVGSVSVGRDCQYTNGYNRNHFLKSTDDEWQDEYRLFWNEYQETKDGMLWANIPKGLAKKVKI